MILRFICIGLFAAFLAMGCNQGDESEKGPKELIVGGWRHAGKVNESLVFGQDGVLTIANPKGDLPPIVAKYTWDGEEKIQITITDAKGADTDEGIKYVAPSWMNFDHMNAMMDGRKLEIVATVKVTPDELRLKIGDASTTYKRSTQHPDAAPKKTNGSGAAADMRRPLPEIGQAEPGVSLEKARPSVTRIEAGQTSGDGPMLSDVTVTSVEASPLAVNFSIQIESGQSAISFDENAALWFCFGKPTTFPSLRSALEDDLKELRPTINPGEQPGESQVRIFLNMGGPGFVAAACDVKQSPDDPRTWTGTIHLSGFEAKENSIEIGSAFGPQRFQATRMPISWLLWDDAYQLSNELKAIVDLKAGKVVELVGDENNDH